ncbi:MAG: flagella synthesis protein FlgN [Thiobacillus sp.]
MSPNESSPNSPALMAKLTVESAAWQALLNVMGEEERALVAGEADLLPQLNASKLAQLQTLSNLARARHDELVAAGHTPDHAGMDTWLARQGNADHQNRWQQLCSMEKQAQAMNQRIGSLIDLRLSSTRQALNVLIHAAKSQGGLYDQAGQSVAARNGKPLTAA